MDDLVMILNEECDQYQNLLELSSRKTPVLVTGDLEKLAEITDEEQGVVANIVLLDKKREEAMKTIADVLNRDVNTLKLTDLIQILAKKPVEQKNLSQARDKLRLMADSVVRVNARNQELINSSLEMVEFEMNILQAAKRAPETANYTKTAGTSGDVIGMMSGRFDAKQ
ncbi:MAG: flagellar protein FlgN [Butyrivibrio sp.]|nr:flagellar protein FlgN [Butyrivibrio sp.]